MTKLSESRLRFMQRELVSNGSYTLKRLYMGKSTWSAVLKCTNPSCLSRSERGYSCGIGDGGAPGMILYTNCGSGEGAIGDTSELMGPVG